MSEKTPGGQEEQLLQQIQRLQAELVETQKLSSVGVLASSITHEFNNVLTTIINYAKMGLRHTDDATREKAFDRILSAGNRAAKITTRMLAYSRSNSEHPETVDLALLVQDILVLSEKDLQIHRVRVDAALSESAWAECIGSQIQQVVLNLIINARQAMADGGRLRVAVRTNHDDDVAEIAIQDSGPGIPSDKLQKIFDPFFSTKSADRSGQGGTGLGLAVCRDIIESHKGRIRVESAVGRGTMFTLKLPLAGVKATASVAS